MSTTPGDLSRKVRDAAQAAFDAVNSAPEATEPEATDSAAVPGPTGSQPDGTAPEATEAALPPVSMEPYFGIDPEGIPAEKWAEVLDHLKRQDSTIGRLNQRLASRRKLEGEESAPIRDAAREAYSQHRPPEPAEVDPMASLDPSRIPDEDFVKALQLDPELLEPRVVAAVGALARELLESKKIADEATSRIEENEASRFWNTSLDDLEAQFGHFPTEWDRESVLRYALDEGIGSPYELYFRLTAVAKAEVEAAAREARALQLREQLKQEQAGGVRPTSSAAGDTPDVTETKDLKKAVEQALRGAERRHGSTLEDAARGWTQK